MKRTESRNRRSRNSTDEDRSVRVPHDSVNEMVLIAAVIVDEGARERYLRTIPAEHMFGTGHAHIWKTLKLLYSKGLHYDPATLRQLGGAELDVQYVEGLISQRPIVPPNLEHHVEMLKWDAARISTAQGAVTSFLEMLRDPRTEPQALRSAAKRIEAGLAVGQNRSLRNPVQLADEQTAIIAARRDGIATYGFGIPGLDLYGPGETGVDENNNTVDLEGCPRLVPGTAPGHVTCVTGVSGSGKTTATANGVRGMWKAGRRITYGAYEQGSGMTLELLALQELGFPRSKFMTGRFTDGELSQVSKMMHEMGERIVFDEIPYEGFTTRERNPNARALDRIAQSIIDSRCDVYVADLFRRSLKEMDPDDEERALMAVQQMAKQLHVHMVLVQQQNSKQVLATKTKFPRLDTIKGSGIWVEVPDLILAWHRPALWKNVPNDIINSFIFKQRHGDAPMMLEHGWDSQYGLVTGGKSVEMRFNDQESEGLDAFWGPLEPSHKV